MNIHKKIQKEILNKLKNPSWNQKKFSEELIKHKKNISSLSSAIENGDDNNYLIPVVCRLGKELALALYLRRNGIEKKGGLQYHHIIGRSNKKILPYSQYISQRNYHANIVVVPFEKHDHNYCPTNCISEKTFNKCVKKYFSSEKFLREAKRHLEDCIILKKELLDDIVHLKEIQKGFDDEKNKGVSFEIKSLIDKKEDESEELKEVIDEYQKEISVGSENDTPKE